MKRLKTGGLGAAVLSHGRLDADRVGGHTVHKYFQLPIDPLRHADQEVIEMAVRRAMRLQVLVVDAVHKMPVGILRFINNVLQHKTGLNDTPFGGIPVVLLADPTLCAGLLENELLHSAVRYSLPRPFGVHSDYAEFVDGLRRGVICADHALTLLRIARDVVSDGAIIIVPTTAAKDDCDRERLDALPGLQHEFIAHTEQLPHPPQDTSMAVRGQSMLIGRLRVKIGARVQLLKDCEPSKKYTLGTILSYSMAEETVTVKDDTGCEVVVRKTTQIFGCCSEEDAGMVLPPLTEFHEWTGLPLRLGYAFTARHAASLPVQSVYVVTPATMQWGDTYLYQAFSRARTWQAVSWKLPAELDSASSPAELAACLRLKLQ